MKITDVTDLVGFTNSQKNKPVEPEKGSFDRENLGPKQTLMSWRAVPKIGVSNLDPRYRRALLSAGFVVLFLLVVMKEFWLIFVVASFIFVTQVLSKGQNKEELYQITTHGLQVESEFYYWDELVDFFFAKKFGNDLLAINMTGGISSRLFLGYHEEDREKIIETLNKYIRYIEKEPDNFVDRTYIKVLDKFDFQAKK